MTEEVLGLFTSQHRDVGKLLSESKVIVKDPAGAKGKDPQRYRGIARVMAQGPDPLKYSPLTTRICWLFEYAPTSPILTVEMGGDALEGDLVLKIGGTEIHVDCKADTAELRSALTAAGISATDCRANAFPGLWEFDFTGGRWSSGVPSFICEPLEPPQDDTETPVYIGSLKIINEAWVSVADGESVAIIETTDWIPFADGAVSSGAVGATSWHYGAGWLVVAWQCREWSFAEDAVNPYGAG